MSLHLTPQPVQHPKCSVIIPRTLTSSAESHHFKSQEPNCLKINFWLRRFNSQARSSSCLLKKVGVREGKMRWALLVPTDMATNRDHTALHILQVFYKPLLLKPHIVLGGGVAQSWHQMKHFTNYFYLVLWALKSQKVECVFFLREFLIQN